MNKLELEYSKIILISLCVPIITLYLILQPDRYAGYYVPDLLMFFLPILIIPLLSIGAAILIIILTKKRKVLHGIIVFLLSILLAVSITMLFVYFDEISEEQRREMSISNAYEITKLAVKEGNPNLCLGMDGIELFNKISQMECIGKVAAKKRDVEICRCSLYDNYCDDDSGYIPNCLFSFAMQMHSFDACNLLVNKKNIGYTCTEPNITLSFNTNACTRPRHWHELSKNNCIANAAYYRNEKELCEKISSKYQKIKERCFWRIDIGLD